MRSWRVPAWALHRSRRSSCCNMGLVGLCISTLMHSLPTKDESSKSRKLGKGPMGLTGSQCGGGGGSSGCRISGGGVSMAARNEPANHSAQPMEVCNRRMGTLTDLYNVVTAQASNRLKMAWWWRNLEERRSNESFPYYFFLSVFPFSHELSMWGKG